MAVVDVAVIEVAVMAVVEVAVVEVAVVAVVEVAATTCKRSLSFRPTAGKPALAPASFLRGK